AQDSGSLSGGSSDNELLQAGLLIVAGLGVSALLAAGAGVAGGAIPLPEIPGLPQYVCARPWPESPGRRTAPARARSHQTASARTRRATRTHRASAMGSGPSVRRASTCAAATAEETPREMRRIPRPRDFRG